MRFEASGEAPNGLAGRARCRRRNRRQKRPISRQTDAAGLSVVDIGERFPFNLAIVVEKATRFDLRFKDMRGDRALEHGA